MTLQVEIKGNKIKAPLKGNDVWLVLKPEEQIRQKYICRLVNNYGFSLEQMEQEVLASNTKRGSIMGLIGKNIICRFLLI